MSARESKEFVRRAATTEEILDLSKVELVREEQHIQHRDHKRDKRAAERTPLEREFFRPGAKEIGRDK